MDSWMFVLWAQANAAIVYFVAQPVPASVTGSLSSCLLAPFARPVLFFFLQNFSLSGTTGNSTLLFPVLAW
jgi:hypothetical protein